MTGKACFEDGVAVGLNLRRLIAVVLVVAVSVATGFAGFARAELETGFEFSPRPMGAEAELVRGGGLLSCGNAVLGGFLLTSSFGLLGAIAGAVLIVCGCDDEIDDMFDTNFTGVCG